MKRLSATLLAAGMLAAVGTASAQTYGGYNTYGSNTATRTVVPDRYGNTSNAIYDYARVLRVDPVIDSRYGGSNTYRTGNNTYSSNGYGNNTYSSNGYGNNNNNTYSNNGYANQSGQNCYNSASRGGYTTDRYGNRVASNDPYYPQQGHYGTDTGRTVATVIGGIAGAVLGSKVGGGTGTYAATAIGSMVGGLAGRQVYESTQRRKYEGNAVEVCDPSDDSYYGNNNSYNNGYNNNGYNNNGYNNSNNGYYGNNVASNDGRVIGYDVTYEYMGRQFVTRTDYHPGDKIRVRVDVRPE
ncbi:membrane protein [Lysobacter helvus]|uniref:Membrane protein n=2 Tax=Lysobacteraceae TaxID=32033 RepID=A0ABM7Q6E1_9GAMM|nr:MULTISPECIES: glycine zipper 2TM domain-containing protein [Lysobacter]BCT92877.1 membrane protein [Lysobacter caseinilyticus]BCT96030.1 membrane protein [Lysobacter helvus]